MANIIVSFTSYPKRIDTVCQVIESLRRQTVQVDKIVLWLSIDEFPDRHANLPENLLSLDNNKEFEIHWVEGNLKSHKKYYYALQKFPNDIVITIDDDTYYEPRMIETLIKSYESHPFSVSARNVHRIYAYENTIAPYSTWNYREDEGENEVRNDLCAIGVGGILYPPKSSKPDWFNKELITKLAENQDDIWLKFQEIRSEIPVVYVKAVSKDYTIEGSQTTSLTSSNIKKDNDICIVKMFEFYSSEKTVKKWFLSLQQVEEILLHKKLKCIQSFAPYRGKTVHIFGAGQYAKYLFSFIKEFIPDIKIGYFLVSDKERNPKKIENIQVLQFDLLPKEESHIILLGVNNENIIELEYLMCDSKNNIWIKIDMSAIKQVYQGMLYIKEHRGHGFCYRSSI